MGGDAAGRGALGMAGGEYAGRGGWLPKGIGGVAGVDGAAIGAAGTGSLLAATTGGAGGIGAVGGADAVAGVEVAVPMGAADTAVAARSWASPSRRTANTALQMLQRARTPVSGTLAGSMR